MVFGDIRASLAKKLGHGLLVFVFFPLVVLISALSYGPMLSEFFTGTDTITLIETSRITEYKDIHEILANPLMQGSPFVEVARFYRPVSTLSYSLDYWLWGMNPFGFHLTNLILHTSAALLILCMVINVLPQRILSAGFSGIAFVLHPILIETVPSLDRRHDILAAVFILLCVIFLAKSIFSQHRNKLYLALSILFQLAAMASKETAFFLPLLLIVFVWLFRGAAPSPKPTGGTFRYVWLYVVSAFIYLGWRLFVLGGLGGYSAAPPSTWSERFHYIGGLFVVYTSDLLSPVDGMWGPILNRGAGVLLLGMILALGPLLTHVLTKEGRSSGPGPLDANHSKLQLFMLAWLLLPLGIFSVSFTFSHRSMYIPAIGLCCLVGLNLEALLLSPRSKKGITHRNWPASFVESGFWRMLPGKAAAVVALCALCLFFRYSPLVCHYGAWHDSAQLTSHLLRQLVTSISMLPHKSFVILNEVPNCLAGYQNVRPTAKEVAFLQAYSFDSWLRLSVPRNQARVVLGRRSQPESFSGSARLTYCLWGKKTLIAFVSLGKKRNTPGSSSAPDYFYW